VEVRLLGAPDLHRRDLQDVQPPGTGDGGAGHRDRDGRGGPTSEGIGLAPRTRRGLRPSSWTRRATVRRGVGTKRPRRIGGSRRGPETTWWPAAVAGDRISRRRR
jgi:hypothetical protein